MKCGTLTPPLKCLNKELKFRVYLKMYKIQLKSECMHVSQIPSVRRSFETRNYHIIYYVHINCHCVFLRRTMKIMKIKQSLSLEPSFPRTNEHNVVTFQKLYSISKNDNSNLKSHILKKPRLRRNSQISKSTRSHQLFIKMAHKKFAVYRTGMQQRVDYR